MKVNQQPAAEQGIYNFPASSSLLSMIKTKITYRNLTHLETLRTQIKSIHELNLPGLNGDNDHEGQKSQHEFDNRPHSI